MQERMLELLERLEKKCDSCLGERKKSHLVVRTAKYLREVMTR